MSIMTVSQSAYTKLLWSDEFSDSSLNLNEWEQTTGFLKYNNEVQTYTDHNTYIKDGMLNIVAKKENEDGAQYTSARLWGKKGFKYGRVESRIKLPKGNGLWPAFWLLPRNSPYGKWPACGEIDILESSDSMNYVDATLHYGTEDKHDQTAAKSQILPDFSADFHVYAVEWEETEIRTYIDETLISTKTKNDWWSANGGNAPFDTEYSVILNLATGGDYPDFPIDDSIFPQTMQVDYVRVYVDEKSSSPEFVPKVLPATDKPTAAPTAKPTTAPTTAPTQAPTTKPTSAPTKAPTTKPTSAPTKAPTTKPTTAPTKGTPVVKKDICYKNACPTKNINDCKLNDAGQIYCLNCPAYAKDTIRCGGELDKSPQCAGNGGCSNGSICAVNKENKVYCMFCPDGYTGDRCEIAPKNPEKRRLRGSKR